MNTVIQHIKNNLPNTAFLGDEKFPVSVTKSFILPLAKTEPQKDGSLIITDDVNQLKVVQKYSGNKCSITFYDTVSGKSELTAEYEAGKLVSPAPAAKKDDVAKAEDKVTTKQFSSKNKFYTGNLKADIEKEYSDNDVKLKTKQIADMNPADQVNEAITILTDCEVEITPVAVYDCLAFFNVLATPEKFYTIYEESQNDKISKDDKNSIETLYRGYQINTGAKTMKKFSSKNVARFVKQFSADEVTDENPNEDGTPETVSEYIDNANAQEEEAIVENCDTKKFSDEDACPECETVVENSDEDACPECEDGEVAVIDEESVKEHGLLLPAAAVAGGIGIAKKAKKTADLHAIGEMKAHKDALKSQERIQKEREKTKQIKIKEAEKTKRRQAKSASGEDKVPVVEVTESQVETPELTTETAEVVNNSTSAICQKGINTIFGKKHSEGDEVAPVEETTIEVKDTNPEISESEDVAVADSEEVKEHGIGSTIANVAKKAFLNKKGKLSIGKTAAIGAATAAAVGSAVKAKRKHDAAVARGYNKAFKNNSGEDEMPVTEENVSEEVCPICGQAPCVCSAPVEAEVAIKQHSYKNVYRFVK